MKTVIRKYDFDKKYATFEYEDALFVDVTFEPITKEWLEKQVTWFTMKGNKKFADAYRHWPYPNEVLQRVPKIKLYDRRYKDWLIRYDEHGVMKIRAGIGQPESALGFLKVQHKVEEVDDTETTD
jgi:hypothetical protein